MENGCRQGWLLHQEQKKVYVNMAGAREPEVLPFGKISGGDILPGLEVNLNELFEI